MPNTGSYREERGIVLAFKELVVLPRGKTKETSLPQGDEHNDEDTAGCCGCQRGAQRGAHNLAEAVQKEAFARHRTLKPSGPKVGKGGDDPSNRN